MFYVDPLRLISGSGSGSTESRFTDATARGATSARSPRHRSRSATYICTTVYSVFRGERRASRSPDSGPLCTEKVASNFTEIFMWRRLLFDAFMPTHRTLREIAPGAAPAGGGKLVCKPAHPCLLCLPSSNRSFPRIFANRTRRRRPGRELVNSRFYIHSTRLEASVRRILIRLQPRHRRFASLRLR